ncbi:MAG TPA: hypothetical protein VGG33_21940 [Polyangia bacterium]
MSTRWFSRPWLFATAAIALAGACSDDTGAPKPDAGTDAPAAEVSASDGSAIDFSGGDTVARNDGNDGNDGGVDGADTKPATDGDVSETGGDAGPLREARSYTTRASFTFTPMGNVPFPGRQLPTEQTVLVHIDPVTNRITLGVRGGAGRVPMQTTDGRQFTSDSSIRLTVPTSFCGASVSYKTLAFTVAGDQLTGQGAGSLEILDGDVAYNLPATMTFAGTIDKTPPTFGENLTGVDPLADPWLPASEPLAAGAKARLHSISGTEALDLVPVSPPGLDLVVGFRKPSRALNYDLTYALTAVPGVDLANNPAAVGTTLTTIAAPAVLMEDGFEGAANTAGGAAVATAALLPPISGTKSVVVVSRFGGGRILPGAAGTSDRFSARFVVNAGDTRVRLALRPLGELNLTASTQGAALRVAVAGGNITQATLPPNETLTQELELPGNRRVYAGPVRTVEIPLPAAVAVGGHVVVDLSVDGPTVCGLPAPKAGYLIDDVRVE